MLQALAADRRAIIVAAAAMMPEMTDHVRSLRASFLGSAVTATQRCFRSFPSSPSCSLTTAPFVGTIAPPSVRLRQSSHAACSLLFEPRLSLGGVSDLVLPTLHATGARTPAVLHRLEAGSSPRTMNLKRESQ